LSFFLVLILELLHTLLPLECYKTRNMPQLLILLLFSLFGVTIEPIKQFGGALIGGVLK
jgi:hypothetical protein